MVLKLTPLEGTPDVPSVADRVYDSLVEVEKFSPTAYRATKGEEWYTQGYGDYGEHVSKDSVTTEPEASAVLRATIASKTKLAAKRMYVLPSLSDDLQVQVIKSWFRGSVSGSPNTIDLINKGLFKEAAEEFLDNDEYKNAVENGRSGVISRMDELAEALRQEGALQHMSTPVQRPKLKLVPLEETPND